MANDPIDELRRTAYPNPERIGCPAPDVFEALKQRKIGFGDPVWKHIEHCSPCYSEFAGIRDALFGNERRSDFRTLLRTSSALIVLFALGSAAYLWMRDRDTAKLPIVATTANKGGEAAVLNFEDGSELRGRPGDKTPNSSERPTSGVQHLPRNQLNLTVYLPLGSPDGIYDLEMVALSGETVWHVEGRASIKDGLTSVPVTGDLRNVPIGQYKFRFRRPDETWHEKDVIVR